MPPFQPPRFVTASLLLSVLLSGCAGNQPTPPITQPPGWHPPPQLSAWDRTPVIVKECAASKQCRETTYQLLRYIIREGALPLYVPHL